MRRTDTQYELTLKLHSIRAVCCMTGLSRSTIYRMMARDLFPKSVKISAGRVAWRQDALVDWLNARGA
jgi:prophage regulatory protein